MSALEVLIGARRQLTEKGWTKGAFARDVRGMIVSSTDPAATCYCLAGALRCVGAGTDGYSEAMSIIECAVLQPNAEAFDTLVEMNDTSTDISQVLAILDQAIVIATESQP